MKIFKFALVASALLLCPVLLGCSEDSSNISTNSNVNDPISHADDDLDLLNSDVNLLFIGNSLTYTNDLPSLVKSEAKKRGIKVGTKSIVQGGYALIDHWEDGILQEEIATGKFDFVVVQQGPSSQEFGRQVLIEYGEKIKKLCDIHGAELVYYMVWPSLSYYHTFDGVIKSHEMAASMNKALLCPVGKVWKQHFDATDDFSYYGSDGFHPSLKGSKVAAKVIYNTLLAD